MSQNVKPCQNMFSFFFFRILHFFFLFLFFLSLCNEKNCAGYDKSNGFVCLEPMRSVASGAVRSGRCGKHKLRYYSHLRNKENRAPRAPTARQARNAPQREGHSAKGHQTKTQNRGSTVHAWNTLISSTDKNNVSSCCSHETLLHFGLQQL